MGYSYSTTIEAMSCDRATFIGQLAEVAMKIANDEQENDR